MRSRSIYACHDFRNVRGRPFVFVSGVHAVARSAFGPSSFLSGLRIPHNAVDRVVRVAVEHVGYVQRLARIADIVRENSGGADEFVRLVRLSRTTPWRRRSARRGTAAGRGFPVPWGIAAARRRSIAAKHRHRHCRVCPSQISSSVAPCGSFGSSSRSMSAKWLACSGEFIPPRLCGPTFQTMSGTSASGTKSRLLKPGHLLFVDIRHLKGNAFADWPPLSVLSLALRIVLQALVAML